LKLLSFHPFSLYANGGGGRILRRLYEGHEGEITSVAVEGRHSTPLKGPVNEHIVYAAPVTRSWMRWHLRTFIIYLREQVLTGLTIRRIQKAAAKIPCDVIHVVHHGPFATALNAKQFADKQLWVSFHDHYTTTNCPFDTSKQLWNSANRRLVISDELGREYQKQFGHQPYELITDGVYKQEVSEPASGQSAQPHVIYFAGLLHIAYIPLFEVLANALDELAKQGQSFKVILRATQELPFLRNRQFEVEYRAVTLNDKELKTELDSAAILYLPIKFTQPDFYLYSLSTKMVGYLGAPGGILYHGPADSAACHLLQTNGAAVSCNSLTLDEMVTAIQNLLKNKGAVSAQAKQLAHTRFDMKAIQARFWQHPVKASNA
jgi:glycosyltransferase involved in cell wall biosynthesis